MPLLHAVYSFEASRVAGQHGGWRRIQECWWTQEEFAQWVNEDDGRRGLPDGAVEHALPGLLAWMEERRMLLRFTPLNEQTSVHLTRVAETVRVTGNVRQYATTGDEPQRPMFEGVAWKPRLRPSLLRNIEPQLLLDTLRHAAEPNRELAHVPGVTLEQGLEDLGRVLDAISHVWGGLSFAQFQFDAVLDALRASWFPDDRDATGLVITAGTGFGKTLGFMIPVLTDALIQTRDAQRRCSQVMLYPRNDLATDQFSGLQKIVKRINHVLIGDGVQHRCFGVLIDADSKISAPSERYPSSGQNAPFWGREGGNVYGGAGSAYGGRRPASVIVASHESFRRRLQHPDVARGLASGLRRIVLDEIHLSQGIQGGHLSSILSRVHHMTRSEHGHARHMQFIGASATIAEPKEHLSNIAPVHLERVGHVEAVPEGSVPLGILHHVLLRPREGRSTIGSVVDATSALLHHRRSADQNGAFPHRGDNVLNLQKSIAFTDSHETVGTWFNNFIRNEMTEEGAVAEEFHNLDRPYAHWHHAPLSCHEGGAEVCASCRTGVHAENPIVVTRDGIELYRRRHAPDDTGGRWDLGLSEGVDEFSIRGLETCPHFTHGTCWWFPEPDTDSREIIHHGQHGPHQHSSAVIRAFRHSSKTREGDQQGPEGVNIAFRKQRKQGMTPNASWNQVALHDLAIATPTLEVGIDMDNVTEVLTHKAIRNVASYRQKVGRAGREIGTDAMAVTILSQRPREMAAFRDSAALIDDELRDPVPVAKRNISIFKNEAYEAAFDYLALTGRSVEWIDPKHRTDIVGRQELLQGFREAIRALSQDEARDYVRNAVLSTQPRLEASRWAREATESAVAHLRCFLLRDPKLDTQPTAIEWIAAMRSGGGGYNALPNPNLERWNAIGQNMNNPGVDEVVRAFTEAQDVDAARAWADGNPDGFPNRMLVPAIRELEDDEPTPQFLREIQALWGELDAPDQIFAYVSCILREVAQRVPSIGEARPYVSLPTMYSNPAEHTLLVERPIQINGVSSVQREHLPLKEGMRFLLPGMWTHRLFKSQCFFVSHDQSLRQIEGFQFAQDLPATWNPHNMMPLGPMGGDANQLPHLLPFRPSDRHQTFRLARVQVDEDRGVRGGRQRAYVQEGAINNEHCRLYTPGDTPAQGPYNRTIQRPMGYPISWTAVRLHRPTNIHTLIPTALSRIPEHDQSIGVEHHPLLRSLVHRVSYDAKATIRRLALGVSRSNGPMLQPHYNQRPVVFVDELNAPAIEFTLNDERVVSLENSASDLGEPFSEQTLFVIGFGILDNAEVAVDTLALGDYLDALATCALQWENATVQADEFPATRRDALELLFRSGRGLPEEVCRRIAESKGFDEDRQEMVIQDMLALHNEAIRLLDGDLSEAFGRVASRWARANLANTTGMMFAEAAAEFSGVSGDAVGYSWSQGPDGLMISIFDDDAGGNGTIDLIRRFFHLPRETREMAEYAGQRDLPRFSFVDLIEEQIAPCLEHVVHMMAVTETYPAAMDESMQHAAHELHERFGEVWRQKGVEGSDGLRTARLLQRARAHVFHDNPAEDEFAMHLCDEGCVACTPEGRINLFPPGHNPYTVHRGLLEAFFFNHEQPPHGYSREVTDLERRMEEAGRPIGDLAVGGALGHDHHIVRRFLTSLGERTMICWPRNNPPETLEWFVRTHEVVE